MTEKPMDANHCMKELRRLIERVEPDVAIYCLTMRLGELLAEQAFNNQEDGARLVEETAELLSKRVAINIGVCDWARNIPMN
jgi:hypothetical protein